MRNILKVGFLAVLMVLLSVDADAQRFTSRKKYWSIGGSINAMNYVGDITAARSKLSVPFKFTRQNIGICAIRRMTPRISGRVNFFYGRMKSDDRKFGGEPTNGPDYGRWHRGANFINNIYELSTTVIIDFYENRGTWQKRPDYTPYAFVGLGAFYHNPKTVLNGQKYFLSEVQLPDGSNLAGSRFQGSFLYGLGFRYKLQKRWDLALEIGWRITTTDKLDGVSGDTWQSADQISSTEHKFIYDKTGYIQDGGTWVRNTNIPNTRGAVHGTDLSNPISGESRGDAPNDGYIVTGLHLTRILGGGVKCPKFR